MRRIAYLFFIAVIILLWVVTFSQITEKEVNSLLTVHAQTNSEQNQPTDSSGEDVFRDSIKRMAGNVSVDAVLRLNIELFGEKFSGMGRYRELCMPRDVRSHNELHLAYYQNNSLYYSANGREESIQSEKINLDRSRTSFRFEINKFLPTNSLVPGMEAGSFVLVCDRAPEKEVYWRFFSNEGKRSLKKIRIDEFEDKLQEYEHSFTNRDFSSMPTLGGLIGIMRQVDEFYDFSLEPAISETIRQENVSFEAWRIRGKLREEKAEQMLQQLGISAKSDPTLSLPIQIPNEVEIILGKDNKFPYHFVYIKNNEKKREIMAELILLEVNSFNIFDISQNFGNNNDTRVNIDVDAFSYIPGGDIFPDENFAEDYIKSLRLKKLPKSGTRTYYSPR